MSDRIADFLSRRRIAIVGVSHEPRSFSRMVFRAFRDRGYEVVPVNPKVRVIDGVYCFLKVQDIEPPVDTVLVLTGPETATQVVKDCVTAGVTRIWLYRKSPEAEACCAAPGLDVIAGECPMMYLSRPGFIHRLHGWFHQRSRARAASAML